MQVQSLLDLYVGEEILGDFEMLKHMNFHHFCKSTQLACRQFLKKEYGNQSSANLPHYQQLE